MRVLLYSSRSPINETHLIYQPSERLLLLPSVPTFGMVREAALILQIVFGRAYWTTLNFEPNELTNYIFS